MNNSQPLPNGTRQSRQFERQRAITEAVMAEGSVRIEQLAERFNISLMTIHRDLNELESRGVLRKSRGMATVTSTSLVESSDVYRAVQQSAEKESLVLAALELIEPGQSIFLDDSTTVLRIAPYLPDKAPLTAITNSLTLMGELRNSRGITLLALGGHYYNWCSAFMGHMTTRAISQLRADVLIMSTSAITNDVVYHQFLETVDTKRAMFDASNKRILLADHTKFERQALHALAPLKDFDVVIVDEGTAESDIRRMHDKGINVLVAPTAHAHRHDSARPR